MTPALNKSLPEFEALATSGVKFTPAAFHGQTVVLYFYPKDNTPGCTTQACELRDNIFAFRKVDAVILGVSVDDVESHKKFSEEHKLPFDILADSEKKVSKQYGVLFSAGPMQLASRQTFLIDPSGKIVKHWPKVDPKGHSEMVLAEIKAHSAAKTG
jgi:peroxiredoxin Q/BCP